MRDPVPHPALRRLDPLAGVWDMYARGTQVGPVRTEFAWLEGGAFLVQRADLGPDTVLPEDWQGHAPFPTSCVTGYDDTADEFTVLYADGRGVARVYRADLVDGVWRQWRAVPGFHQRFAADVDPAGRTLTGAWEFSEDGALWRRDFDVTYRRVR
ncbi:hypothetical protein [Streptomyces abyssomicinicus]|uniref:hypothetical protein n=1 Tax=Streptomyces abyssomicinicus TaxID=574929 RepID=UPI00125008A9|nr:hypothetical protein [Streptomyces abyssomicinicus]